MKYFMHFRIWKQQHSNLATCILIYAPPYVTPHMISSEKVWKQLLALLKRIEFNQQKPLNTLTTCFVPLALWMYHLSKAMWTVRKTVWVYFFCAGTVSLKRHLCPCTCSKGCWRHPFKPRWFGYMYIVSKLT